MEYFYILIFMMPSILLALLIFIKLPCIAKPVAIGLVARLLLIFIHNYVVPLPGGLFDAMAFEEAGWLWAQAGLQEIINQVLAGPRSHFYSTHVALIYYIFGRLPILSNFLSLFFAILIILLSYLTVEAVWQDKKLGIKAAWVASLFPWFLVYSIHARREVFIFFAVIAGMYMLVRWRNEGGYKYLLFSLLIFAYGVFYHTGLVFAIIGVALLVLVDNFNTLVTKGAVKLLMLFAFMPVMVAAVFMLANMDLANIGSSDTWLNVDETMDRISGRAHGGAAYPSFVIASSPLEMLFKAPLSVIYFFGAPFIWDVRSPHHLVGLIDGTAYVFMMYIFARNFKSIWRNKTARALLIVFFPMLLAFVFTVGNFGNGMRHRQKFLIILVALIAPFVKLKVKLRR